jgi:hypothetical protein
MKKILALALFTSVLVTFSCSTKDSGNSTQGTQKPITLDPVKPDGETPAVPSGSSQKGLSPVAPKVSRDVNESNFDYEL